jgi:hypothetical protein
MAMAKSRENEIENEESWQASLQPAKTMAYSEKLLGVWKQRWLFIPHGACAS